MSTVRHRIEDGISELLLEEGSGMAFVGYCLSQFEIRQANAFVPTMGVCIAHGSLYLFYNEAFVETLSNKELLGILEHEVLHVLHVHMARQEHRTAIGMTLDPCTKCNPKAPDGNCEGCHGKGQVLHDHSMFNIACDMAINPMVKHELPKDKDGKQTGCWPEKGWENHSAEWIYEKLLEKMDQNKKISLKGMTQDGKGTGQQVDDHGQWNKNGDQDGKAQSSVDKAMTEAVVKAMVEEAVQKSKGDLPGGWEEVVKQILKSKVDWRQLLRYYYSSLVRTQRMQSWRRRSRRRWDKKFLFPGYLKQRGIEVIAAVDTSGSIGSKEIEQFFGELESLVSRHKSKTWMIQCDAMVHEFKEYKKGDWRKVKVKGRGGTDFRPVFDEIEKRKIQPNILIYLTDCLGTFPTNPPKYQTLWICTNEQTMSVPFGKVIPLKCE